MGLQGSKKPKISLCREMIVYENRKFFHKPSYRAPQTSKLGSVFFKGKNHPDNPFPIVGLSG